MGRTLERKPATGAQDLPGLVRMEWNWGVRMKTGCNRREFLLRSSSMALGGALLRSAGRGWPSVAASGLKKGLCIGVLPEGLSVLEKLEMAKSAGFEDIEPNTPNTAEEVKHYREGAEKTGVKITSIMNSDHWKYPLSDNDPEVVKKRVEADTAGYRHASSGRRACDSPPTSAAAAQR
jgi:hypothetical protein